MRQGVAYRDKTALCNEGSKTMKCCGQDVETPYCPMCGSPQNHKAGQTLLDHIYTRVKGYKIDLSEAIHNSTSTSEETARLEQAVKEWEGWLAFVAEAIKAKDQYLK